MTVIIKKHLSGHILMATLVAAAIIGIALAAFLNLLTSENSYTVRSQVWNDCMPLVEAGLDEAMAHINDTTDTNWNDNGWAWNGEAFTKQRFIGNSYFNVSIATNTGVPVITSTGFIPAPVTVGSGSNPFAQVGGGNAVNYISRTVKITTKREPFYTRTLLAKENIDFSGNNCLTDSYNSNLGSYFTQTPGDKGDIATNYRGSEAVNAGNANIKGHINVGPGAWIDIGPNGSAGSAGWVNVPTPGIEPGWARSDQNSEIPDVTPPWTGSAVQPGGKALYKYWLDGGNYEMAGDLALGPWDQMYVNGNATLWVKGESFVFGKITISQPGSLRIYCTGKRAFFVGTWDKSIAPADLQIFGLPTCTVLWISPGQRLESVINAPQADITITGTDCHLFGCAVMRSLKFMGNGAYHFDEALLEFPKFKPYTVGSWEEI
jgi:hypothetical protein